MKSIPPVIETVLFDMDGTLVDSFEAFYQICKHGCEQIGHPIPDRASLYPVMNEGVSFFELCFPAELPERQSRIDAFLTETRRVRTDLLVRHAAVMPDAEALLQQIHDKYKLGIVTSSSSSALEPLRLAGITKYFDVIVTRDDVQQRKPHPEGIRQALRTLHREASGALMVGDTPMDIQAGRAAGLQTAGVLSSTDNARSLKRCAPDMIFSTLKDLGVWLSLDESRRTLPGGSAMLQGTYRSGLGKATGFLSIDGVRERIESIAGFVFAPGTFNLELNAPSVGRLRRFRERHDPDARRFGELEGFCDAILYPCLLQSGTIRAEAFALFPLVPGYPSDKVELVSTYRLVDRLGTESDPNIIVSIIE